MTMVTYEGREHSLRPGETVLEALQRRGVEVLASCRAGICNICLLRQVDGSPPREVQAGLRPELQERGYFLACRYRPEHDIEVAPQHDSDLIHRAIVI
ncbi:MAG: 2Fe-2S iron-sulfur cluster binding domain-containing protein, partial [Holophagales bacterium]|nr:2Fe-2S iron-sulfur cluster binding domain-containing protein [Holophagales bacterium]